MSDEENQGTTATEEAPAPVADTGTTTETPSTEEAPPAWAQQIGERMDQLVEQVAPQAQSNPYAAFGLDGLTADPSAAPVNPDPNVAPQADPAQQGQPQYGQQAVPGDQSPFGEDGQVIEQFLDERAQTAAQNMIQPYIQRLEAERRQSDAQSLIDDYPELKDRDSAQKVVDEANQWAQALGTPELAGEPAFVELVLNAGRSLQRAQSENPAGGTDGVPLEVPGASNPGTGQPESEADRAQSIVNAGRTDDPARRFWMG